MKNGYQYRTTYAIEQTKADVIVFGSSRATHHYYPPVFKDRFKLSFYNAGRDGQESSLYHYAILKAILKRYTPKIVILDLMNGELGKKLYSYDRLASLAPYYKHHPEMRSIIELRSGYEKLKMMSSTYPFNSLIMNIISGNFDVNAKKNINIEGYLPISPSSVINAPIETKDHTKEYELDSVKINVLKLFIKDCTEAKIRLYIVCSPYYEKFTGTDFSMINIKRMAQENKVPFIDFSQSPVFLQSPDMFMNPWHLNDKGAKVFSKMLADSVSFYSEETIFK
jgi:hypothetical protein